MAIERQEGDDENYENLAHVQGEIVIRLGMNAEGQRGMTYEFLDLLNTHEDGSPSLLSYFDGNMMLACAKDDFMVKHFNLQTGE
ncbi:hypothetical protein PBI_OAKER_4 [Mycobacterium phage Oaker]|uniref:Uncharacterized protein n=1 Tax=Mycobacterium phage Konstantine TaxID=563121 RepID=B5U4X4_9CAUD|nr:gp4 [Mycobacterium phage Konstantine]YP_009007285.1 hypothetical protein CH12_gp04 [Mycobacterium phage Oaker]ACI12420.1 hypothetical protein KONSTANTINE_4 [Mycobacterium phage Konstantine]AHG24395.1 hypothetical protein PBI_OAKER_4 [Mycobacterium phage Oaker]